MLASDLWALSDNKFGPKGRQGRQIAAILNSFDFTTCNAWKCLTNCFGTGVRHKELCSIAQVITYYFPITKISRDAHRSFPVLIKWFQDNWQQIEPILPLITLMDADEKVINYERELQDRQMKW
jgi:hypothetical protein